MTNSRTPSNPMIRGRNEKTLFEKFRKNEKEKINYLLTNKKSVFISTPVHDNQSSRSPGGKFSITITKRIKINPSVVNLKSTACLDFDPRINKVPVESKILNFLLNPSAREEKKSLFSLRFFSKPRFLRRKNFGRLES